jgi:hypothetical protein
MGYYTLFVTIGEDYFSLYTEKGDDVSALMGFSNLAGILACIIVSTVLDKVRKYRLIFIILNIAAIVVHILLTTLLELTSGHGFLIVYILWCLVSSLTLPIFTCSMDYVCELTYPVGESITGGLIMSLSQISGLLAVYTY